MCTQGYLTRIEKDVSYLVWRSRVHQFSAAEVQIALRSLKINALKECPDKKDACDIADVFFESRCDELNRILNQ